MTSRCTLLAFALVLVTATFASAMPQTVMVEEVQVIEVQPMTMSEPMMMDSRKAYVDAMRGTGYLPPTMMFQPVHTPAGLRVIRTENPMGLHPRMSGNSPLNMRALYQNAPYETVYTREDGRFVKYRVPTKVRNAPTLMQLGPNMHPMVMSPQQANPSMRGIIVP